MNEPLPDIPVISVIFVRTTFDEVASYYRGELLSAQESDPEREFYELRDEAAKIELGFGPDTDLCHIDKRMAEAYSLRGSVRVSIVRSNPSLVMVEQRANVVLPFEDQRLHQWTGCGVFQFWSTIGEDPLKKLAPKLFHLGPIPENGFSYIDKNTGRHVCAYQDNTKAVYNSSGEPLDFERPSNYKKRRKLDRVNRELIFEYMSAIGVDPVATFLRRELDSPILFSSDHGGTPVTRYVKERDRYIEYCREQNLL
ncbi:hypothetical protein [Halovulum sp. GXIMD14793]